MSRRFQNGAGEETSVRLSDVTARLTEQQLIEKQHRLEDQAQAPGPAAALTGLQPALLQ